MTATPENLAVFACPLDGMSLVEASAGTGKTWNICALYLRLLLEQELTVPEILVLTFTTAATAELKERIYRRMADTLLFLEAGATPDGADPFFTMLAGWMDETQADPARMKTLLEAALASFDEAAIFTIHGFCQKALAASAFSAGTPFSATVEPEDTAIVAEVANDFWRRHVASGDVPPELLMYLTARRISPEHFRDFLLREFKKPLAKRRWPADVEGGLAGDFGALVEAFETMRRSWQAEKPAIRRLLAEAVESGQFISNRFSPKHLSDAMVEYELLFQRGDAISAFRKDGADEEARLDRFTVGGMARRKKKNGQPPSHAFFSQAGAWMMLRAELLAELEKEYHRLLYRLSGEVAEVKRRRQQKRVISYDDMLGNLHEALTGGRFPELAASLRATYPAALIDEFQDTDPVQYAIFSAIYAGTKHPVFFVGDPKQAIYSFRNADLHTYLRAKADVSRHFSLSRNQRSTPALIAATNALFTRNTQAFMMAGLDYVPVSPGERPHPPFVDNTLQKGQHPDGMRLWRLPENDEGEGYLERKGAMNASGNAVADEIVRLLAAGKQGLVCIGDRPLAASDIAVLVRSHREGDRMKQLLAARRVGSISLSQESIWQSADARELALLLAAILLPRDTARQKAALVTEILGFDSAAISQLAADEAATAAWTGRFMTALADWQAHGVGYVINRLMTELGVYPRMLARPDGERRLTNLVHLAELLKQASENHETPEALLRWYRQQLDEQKGGDDALIRLESDEERVRILTIHRAKGLEFPVVFCPFLWDARQNTRTDGLPGRTYQDGDELVIDFREMDKEEADAIQNGMRMESAFDTLRLCYVALTRAVYRCYLVAGCYRTSASGLLNWLVAGEGFSPEDWHLKGDTGRQPDIEAAWQALAAGCESILLQDLPVGDKAKEPLALPADTGETAAETLKAAPLPRSIPFGWRLGSYTALTQSVLHEATGADHDELTGIPEAPEVVEDAPLMPEADDILLFPRSRYAGNCLHAVFEEADFTCDAGWDEAIENALTRHPPDGSAGIADADERAALAGRVRRMLKDVLSTVMPGGVRLADVGREKRLTEMEFHLPARGVTAAALNTLLAPHYPMAPLDFGRLKGWLKGFIDLVFEDRGRFYILDWKSNFLGARQADYGDAAVGKAMADHAYHLQHLLYTVALSRYLKTRLPDYDYARDFGGVFYLFVRGVRPGWKTAGGAPCGVYFHKADEGLIQALDALFDGDGNGEAT